MRRRASPTVTNGTDCQAVLLPRQGKGKGKQPRAKGKGHVAALPEPVTNTTHLHSEGREGGSGGRYEKLSPEFLLIMPV